jgi:aerobic-type carbon monoxide dehydrogenase small subunit (CoxS/CutS family)
LARLLSCRLNGRDRSDAVADNILLLDYLREKVGLTGTKTGCDGGECGACTVLVDDKPTLSCLTLAATVQGKRVDTIESLGHDEATLRRATRLPREARLAMRLLHARIHHGVGRIAAAKSRSER